MPTFPRGTRDEGQARDKGQTDSQRDVVKAALADFP